LNICIYLQKDNNDIDENSAKCISDYETDTDLPKALIEGTVKYVYYEIDFPDLNNVQDLYVYAQLIHGKGAKEEQIEYSQSSLTPSTKSLLSMSGNCELCELEAGLLAKIYAKRQITKWTEIIDRTSYKGNKNEIRDKLIDLSIKSKVMSKYTSMVLIGAKSNNVVTGRVKVIINKKIPKNSGSNSAQDIYKIDETARKNARNQQGPPYDKSTVARIIDAQTFSGAFDKTIYEITQGLYSKSKDDMKSLSSNAKQPDLWVQTMVGITELLDDSYDDKDIEMILVNAFDYVTKKENCSNCNVVRSVNDAIQEISRAFGSGKSEIDYLISKAALYM